MIKRSDLPINPPRGVMLRCPDGCNEVSADRRDYFGGHDDDYEFRCECGNPLQLTQRVTTYRKWTTPKRFKRHQP